MEGEAAPAGRLGREQRLALIIIAALLGFAGIIAVVVSAISSGGGSDAKAAESAYPNGDPANSRHFGGQITGATVASLKVAWSAPLTAESQGFGAEWSTPVIAEGVAYTQDAASDVEALALASGKVLWERQYDSPVEGPNGVLVSGHRVYGATATNAFALDGGSGEELWSTPLAGKGETIDMAPGYEDGLVYVSTLPSALKGGEVGTLWALDAKTGKKVWSFATVPKALWGRPETNYGGGLWQAPAFDGEGGMYFGVANPGPLPGTNRYPWGKSRPGPNLYTNSIVKLDAKTGKLEWYHQVTPHALCDWDLQGPPLLVEAGGRKLVVIGGKGGIVVALDRDSGKLVWKRVVGVHNGHDGDGVRAMHGDYSGLKVPQTVYPGSLGGVLSPPSTDGSLVFVPVVNHPTTLLSQGKSKEGGAESGELLALDVASGAVRWRHRFSAAPIGATSVVNELVLATTVDGKVYAFENGSGKLVWENTLPAGVSGGLGIGGDTMLAPAGTVTSAEQSAELVAYRIGG